MNLHFTLLLFLLSCVASVVLGKKEKDPEEEYYKGWKKSCDKKDFGCSVWCQANNIPGFPLFCGGVCQGWFAKKCTCIYCPPGTEYLFPFPNIYPLTRGRPPSFSAGETHSPTKAPSNRDQQFMSEAIIPFRK